MDIGQHNLALAYRLGRGINQDFEQARIWYLKAAAQGYAPSEHNLGAMYEQGLGVQKDNATAMKWYRRAAQRGFALSYNALGIMYVRGAGVPENKVAACGLFLLAANKGNSLAPKNLQLVQQGMKPEELKRAQTLAEAMSRPGQVLNELDVYLKTSS